MKTINRQGINFIVNDDTENAEFWNIGGWESKNYEIVKIFSSKCSTFVDVGGWIGPFTLFAGKLYKSVYSLEPDPTAFNELKRNVESNHFSNVSLVNKAIFDKNKSEINMGSDYSPLGRSGTSIFQSDKSIKVQCVTLKSFFETNNISVGSFLMLDVEGAEYVLFDDIEFFNKYKPTILTEFHLKFLNDELFDHLMKSLSNLKHLYNIDLNSFKKGDMVHRLFELI